MSVKAHATTRDGTARAASDHLAESAALVFKPRQRHKTFTVGVIGDQERERNETFSGHLSAAKGARVTDAETASTIVNDD